MSGVRWTSPFRGAAAKLLTRDEARRVAAIANETELLHHK
jgi:hypothetical protein